MRLTLASNSPRRRELLSRITARFSVEPSLFEESAKGLSAYETVLFNARGKAGEVFSRFPNDVVLGADTVVCLNGEVLGKPKDKADAVRMLSLLSGKTHEVYTGVCVHGPNGEFFDVVKTEVVFHPLSEEFIGAYVAGGSPMDKAGAYGIQDGGLVARIEGSYSNVVGLPIEETRALLSAHGGIIC